MSIANEKKEKERRKKNNIVFMTHPLKKVLLVFRVNNHLHRNKTADKTGCVDDHLQQKNHLIKTLHQLTKLFRSHTRTPKPSAATDRADPADSPPDNHKTDHAANTNGDNTAESRNRRRGVIRNIDPAFRNRHTTGRRIAGRLLRKGRKPHRSKSC